MPEESDTNQRSDDAALQADGGPDVRSTNRLPRGLWPASKKAHTPEWNELIHCWFVQYNPLYFFSAFCFLGGVYLLALELDGNALAGGDWSLALVFLFAVIQLYEFLLIAAAGFLAHKIGLIRTMCPNALRSRCCFFWAASISTTCSTT